MERITVDRLKTLLHYDEMTGAFTRVSSTGGRGQAGDPAGYVAKSGYVRIGVDYVEYAGHHLAWLYMMGEMPDFQIDHENLIRSDNRWSNLRKATPKQNNANCGARVTNTSGFKGVYWSKHAHKWRASIQIDGKQKNLGYRDDPRAAADLYAKEAERAFGEFHRVR